MSPMEIRFTERAKLLGFVCVMATFSLSAGPCCVCVGFNLSPPYFLRQYFSLDLELADKAKLAGQSVPGICQPPSPKP